MDVTHASMLFRVTTDVHRPAAGARAGRRGCLSLWLAGFVVACSSGTGSDQLSAPPDASVKSGSTSPADGGAALDSETAPVADGSYARDAVAEGSTVQTPDGGNIGSGATTTKVISSSGGTITVSGSAGVITLTLPPGAVTNDTVVTITETTDPPPSGYTTYSPVFKFQPEGTTFAKPITISLPF